MELSDFYELLKIIHPKEDMRERCTIVDACKEAISEGGDVKVVIKYPISSSELIITYKERKLIQ